MHNYSITFAERLVLAIPFGLGVTIAAFFAAYLWPPLLGISLFGLGLVGAGMGAILFVRMPLPTPLARATGQTATRSRGR